MPSTVDRPMSPADPLTQTDHMESCRRSLPVKPNACSRPIRLQECSDLSGCRSRERTNAYLRQSIRDERDHFPLHSRPSRALAPSALARPIWKARTDVPLWPTRLFMKLATTSVPSPLLGVSDRSRQTRAFTFEFAQHASHYSVVETTVAIKTLVPPSPKTLPNFLK